MKSSASFITTLALVIAVFASTNASADFQESFDGVAPPALPAGWTGSAMLNTWNTSTDTPDSPPNCAFCGALSVGGGPPFFGNQTLTSPSISISNANAILSFRHKFSLGAAAARLEIAWDDTGFQEMIAAGGQFIAGGYNNAAPLESPFAGDAWVGDRLDYFTTFVRLPAAAAGQTVQLRWRAAD